MPEKPNYTPEQNQNSQKIKYEGRSPEESKKIMEQMIADLDRSQAKIDSESDAEQIFNDALSTAHQDDFNAILEHAEKYGLNDPITGEEMTPDILSDDEILAEYPENSKS